MLTENDQLLNKENETQRELNQPLFAFDMAYRFARCSNPSLVAEQIVN